MKYALHLEEDRRILSATYPQFAPEDAVIVDVLPEGDISDYLYINGEFVYDPLPKPVEPENVPSQLDRVESQVVYLAMMTGYTDILEV